MGESTVGAVSVITWKPNLSVGIADVDEDHKKLIKMINRLFGAALSPQPGQILGDVLEELTRYVVFHFNREEEYMRRFDYPGFVEHKKEHERLIDTATRFKRNLDSGLAMNLKDEIEKSLRDWLVVHIQGQDRHLGHFLNEQGVK
ncbi:MAG: bacteriohemerythrin [Magnetococcus sp. DMHC-1]|nr:hemerythrin family protein [Magnetococcales bacterium]